MWKPFWFGLCTGMCSKSGLGHGFVGTVLSCCLGFACLASTLLHVRGD